jgi:glycerol-3-phosphate dehydrogenase (NAD(P)+)
MPATVAILGAGAWGTALAIHLAARSSARPRVTLWSRDAAQAAVLAAHRENVRYLPGHAFPAGLTVSGDLAAAAASDLLIVATPVAAVSGLVRQLRGLNVSAPLIWLSKGFVVDAEGMAPALLHQVIGPLWAAPVGVVSGPSFAEEVATGLPTAVAVAASDAALAAEVAALLRGGMLRAYESDDIVGVEIGGAVKNVLAIAAGASDGLAFGHNARAALITRGLAEMARLVEAMGGRRETMMGLAGLGDLVLTCTGDLSRNRRVGLGLAQGKPLPQILAELGHVAEGVPAARAVTLLAARHRVDMPISDAVNRVLHDGLPVRRAVEALLSREPRPEAH